MEIKMILVDSNIFIAYANKDDELHSKSLTLIKNITRGLYGKVIISDYIFSEVVTVTFLKTKNLSKAIEIGKLLLKSRIIKIINIESYIFQLSWDIFQKQDGGLSFTDCSILALMKEENIRYIATFDRDFKEFNEVQVVDS